MQPIIQTKGDDAYNSASSSDFNYLKKRRDLNYSNKRKLKRKKHFSNALSEDSSSDDGEDGRRAYDYSDDRRDNMKIFKERAEDGRRDNMKIFKERTEDGRRDNVKIFKERTEDGRRDNMKIFK